MSIPTYQRQREEFFQKNGPNAIWIQASHSTGSIIVYNALKSSPKRIRMRIISIAIAPAKIIPKSLCLASHNYVSKRDFVPMLDIVGFIKNHKQLIRLDPHPDAKFWDHDFKSPTFETTTSDLMEFYIKKYGGVE